MQPKNFLTEDINNISMSEISAQATGEWSEKVWCTPHGKVERIVSLGHVSPQGFWYDQAEDEFVLILQGSGAIQFAEGETQELKSGDWVIIPAHRRHRVAWSSSEPPCVWLCVFYS